MTDFQCEHCSYATQWIFCMNYHNKRHHYELYTNCTTPLQPKQYTTSRCNNDESVLKGGGRKRFRKRKRFNIPSTLVANVVNIESEPEDNDALPRSPQLKKKRSNQTEIEISIDLLAEEAGSCPSSCSEKLKHIMTEKTRTTQQLEVENYSLRIKNDELDNLNKRLQHELLDEWRVLSVGLTRVDRPETTEEVAVGDRVNGQVHLGRNVWLPQLTYDGIDIRSKTTSAFIRNLCMAVFGAHTLSTSSVTGQSSNRTKGEKLPALDPIRLAAIHDMVKFRLQAQGYSEDVIKKEVKNIDSTIACKIMDLRRAPRTTRDNRGSLIDESERNSLNIPSTRTVDVLTTESDLEEDSNTHVHSLQLQKEGTNRNEIEKNFDVFAEEVARASPPSSSEILKHPATEETSAIQRLQIENNTLRSKNEELDNLNKRLQHELLDKWRVLSVGLTTVDTPETTTEVGVGDRVNGQVHLGRDVWLPQLTYDGIDIRSKTTSAFIRNLCVAVFGAHTLSTSSVTGQSSNRFKGEKFPALDPTRLAAIHDMVKFRLQMEGHTEDVIKKEVKNIDSTIASKIADLRRPPKTTKMANKDSMLDERLRTGFTIPSAHIDELTVENELEDNDTPPRSPRMNRNETENNSNPFAEKVAEAVPPSSSETLSHPATDKTGAIQQLEAENKTLRNKNEELDNLNKRLQHELLDEWRVLSVGLTRVDKPETTKEVVVGDRVDGQVYLGRDVWLPQLTYDGIDIRSKTTSAFVRNLCVAIFGADTLSTSSVTGQSSNRTKGEKFPALDPTKLAAIHDMVKFRLQMEGHTEDVIKKELKNIDSTIASKITDLRRPPKTTKGSAHEN